jgi:hypothetical protein
VELTDGAVSGKSVGSEAWAVALVVRADEADPLRCAHIQRGHVPQALSVFTDLGGTQPHGVHRLWSPLESNV